MPCEGVLGLRQWQKLEQHQRQQASFGSGTSNSGGGGGGGGGAVHLLAAARAAAFPSAVGPGGGTLQVSRLGRGGGGGGGERGGGGMDYGGAVPQYVQMDGGSAQWGSQMGGGVGVGMGTGSVPGLMVSVGGQHFHLQQQQQQPGLAPSDMGLAGGGDVGRQNGQGWSAHGVGGGMHGRQLPPQGYAGGPGRFQDQATGSTSSRPMSVTSDDLQAERVLVLDDMGGRQIGQG